MAYFVAKKKQVPYFPKNNAPYNSYFRKKTSSEFNSKKRKKSFVLLKKNLDFDFSFKKKEKRGCYFRGNTVNFNFCMILKINIMR